MSRFVEITFQEGSAHVTKIINLDMVVDFNYDKRKLAVCYGQAVKLYVLTPESADALHQVLSTGCPNDPWTLISQLQRDVQAYENFFVNILGWTNGSFREKRRLPAIGLFGNVSDDVNDQLDMMFRNLRDFNEEYLYMKDKLKEVGIVVNFREQPVNQ